MNSTSIYLKAIDHYGSRKQLIKLIEEMNELSKEICKYLVMDPDSPKLAEEIDHIAEETADVFIMLQQLTLIFPDMEQQFEDWKRLKILRLKSRIEQEEVCVS